MRSFFTVLLAVLLLFSPFVSLAEQSSPSVTVQSVISRFLEEQIDPEAVVRPLNPESNLKMLNLTAAEAYLGAKARN